MPLLETAYLLNPGTRRRRARRARGRRARRSNTWRGASRRHAAAARKGWRGRRRGRRMDNPRRRRRRYARRANPRRRRRRYARRGNAAYMAANPRRRRRYGRRRRNPAGALSLGGVKLGFPEVVPGLRVPLPGVVGTIVNGAIQAAAAGGVVFAGYFGSGALANYIVSTSDAKAARAAGDTFKGYWARPLIFAGTAGLLGGLAAAVAPKGKGLLWSLLAAAGPALRAFGGVVYALLGDDAIAGPPGFKQDVAKVAAGLADYLQVDDIYEAGMGQEEEGGGMEDFLQVDGTSDIYEAGMGEEAEEAEVIGI